MERKIAVQIPQPALKCSRWGRALVMTRQYLYSSGLLIQRLFDKSVQEMCYVEEYQTYEVSSLFA